MSLDTISQVLKAECCWIQTSDSGKAPLSLVASRGLNPEMQAEITSMDIDHDFVEIIVGTGQKIVIPDLSNDGLYGLSSFAAAGYRWLIAVPLLTYRVFGLMGIASRRKKNFQKETPDLALVIGGLIANAINKAELLQKSINTPKEPHGNGNGNGKTPKEEIETRVEQPPPEKKTPELPRTGGTSPPSRSEKRTTFHSNFHDHTKKMESFRRSHRS